MASAHMKCIFKEVRYPAGQPDVGCTLWGGVIDFAASNGSYTATYPFVNLSVKPGETVPVGALIYDGIGGNCGQGTVQLTFRVTVSGKDAAGNIVAGSNTVTVDRPPTPPGRTISTTYIMPVPVTNAGTGAAATKWFVFTVITMC